MLRLNLLLLLCPAGSWVLDSRGPRAERALAARPRPNPRDVVIDVEPVPDAAPRDGGGAAAAGAAAGECTEDELLDSESRFFRAGLEHRATHGRVASPRYRECGHYAWRQSADFFELVIPLPSRVPELSLIHI